MVQNIEESQSIIEKPMKIGGLEIAGRVFKTATAETKATEDGFVTDELLEFYEPIVDAGTPLIMSGNLYTSATGKSSYKMTGVDNKDKIPGLKRLADLVHAGKAKIFGQINHCGRQIVPEAMGLDSAVSASNVTEKLMGTKPRALRHDEIKEITESFASAAEYCQAADFDGLQLHGGHGYLINQFLTPYTNRRTDEYGGNFKNRMRFLLESYHGIRERVGPDFPLIIKLNGDDKLFARNGLGISQMLEIARILQEEGMDGIEITVGHYESGFPMIRGKFDTYFHSFLNEGFGHQVKPFRRYGLELFKYPISKVLNRLRSYQEGFNLKYAVEFKKNLSIPVICVGGFQTKPKIESAIQEGLCDAVSVGRAMISDPYLYKNLIEDKPGPDCDFCNGCIARWGSMPVECYNEDIKRQKDIMLAHQN
ncbi:MAG: NADH:flavin oxidoreductase [Desulfobacterales bacterium]|nr:NADH:flavin oxidoreductase [Desulfobacterales bacterium]